MFLASVLTGDTHDFGSMQKDQQPLVFPIKADGLVVDTIKTSIEGETVYAVANNKRAYPKFLVTYSL
jgi:hypothetical protein